MADTKSFMTEAGAIDISLPTDADLSALQYCFVKTDSTDGKVVACGANEKPLGVLQNKPNGATKDDLAIVRLGGVSKLKINETVIPGNFLTSTSGSLGEVCDAAGEEYGARALCDGVQNDLISVLVCFGETEASDA